MNSRKFKIAVLPGDGIGLEVMPLCLALLDDLASHFGSFEFHYEHLEAGAACYQRCGEALPNEVLDSARSADAILLGAMGLPDVRYSDGTEIAPQLDLRFDMNLYAGVRPVKPNRFLPLPLRNRNQNNIDFVLIRESTEGLFASHGKGDIVEDSYATDTMKISRKVCEEIFHFSFALTRARKSKGFAGQLTCVDKANVFKSMAFFRKIFDQVGADYRDLVMHHMYVDAAALNMVRQPWDFDVLVTENMFGDILSDLGAGLMGGMGMAPSADIGERHAVFQPCHGSAPDIAGLGRANPVAMLLSASMLLQWLGERHQHQDLADAARLLESSVEYAFESKTLVPMELGGDAGTQEVYSAVCQSMSTRSNLQRL